MKKATYLGISALALVFSLVLAGCPTSTEGPETTAKAEAPFITAQPNDYQPAINDLVTLRVEASVSDGGSLSYQWYKAASVGGAGTAVENAAESSFAPPTDTANEGKSYYYAEVSNAKDGTRTSVKSRYATVYVLDPASIGQPTGGYNILVDTSDAAKHQFVRGFGGMINAWDSSPDMTVTDADMLFNPDKLGLNILRMIIYPEPLEDIMGGLVYTSIDNSDYFDIGKVVNKYGGMIIGCPWTPPDGYKTSDGHLNTNRYTDMADHLIGWVKKMEAGMGGSNKIFALSSQNEPDGNASWCIYTPEENRDFVKAAFPRIRQQIPHVKLFPGEYADFDQLRYSALLNDPEALALVDGLAGHIYGVSDVTNMSWATNSGKEVWMTEHLRNTAGNYAYDPTWAAVWDLANDFYNCMMSGYNAYVHWYAKRFYGLIGDSEPTVPNQRNGAPQLRGLLMSHYAKYAAGKHRYDANWVGADFSSSATAPTNIRASAYMDDATITMVLTDQNNTGADSWINIRLPQAVTSAFAIETYDTSGPSPTNSAVSETTAAQQPAPVVLSADKKTASVKLRPYSFLSIRFYK
jgi:glucuronoarabinoxylan endo-1,4-beta-xylanase